MKLFLSPLSVWNLLDASGFLFVLLGVVFGFVTRRKKYRHSDDPNDLMPIFFGKKQWEAKKEKRENFWEYVLIIGLGLELAVLPHSIKEVEELHRANLVLQAQIQPRRITKIQQDAFIEFLKATPKGPVRMVVRNLPSETQDFADDIYDMLIAAGFTIPGKIERNENHLPNIVKPGFDLEVIIRNRQEAPVFSDKLVTAFIKIPLKIQANMLSSDDVSTLDVKSNEFVIFVNDHHF